MNIIVDTREQTPWHFPRQTGVTVCRRALPAGDYALEGDDGFAIERKSLNDFVGTITRGWDRFQRELERMEGWPNKVIIVESDLDNMLFRDGDGVLIPPDYDSMVEPQLIKKRIAQLTMQGCSVLFCRDAGMSAAMALTILKERERNIEIGR